MRIIYNAPGQTCNKPWAYLTSGARCIVQKKKWSLFFFDWTIEDFPTLLHCSFIYFPHWQKRYL